MTANSAIPSLTGTAARIVEAAHTLFYEKGYTRVGVDEIAARAGLTKRSLYYHFASKDDLVEAVLARHHELAMARLQSWSQALPRDPVAMIRDIVKRMTDWAATPGWTGAGFTRLALELADLPGHPARRIARLHKAALRGWFAAEFRARHCEASEALAGQAVLLLEGALVMMVIDGAAGPAQEALAAMEQLIAVGSPAPVPARGMRG